MIGIVAFKDKISIKIRQKKNGITFNGIKYHRNRFYYILQRFFDEFHFIM